MRLLLKIKKVYNLQSIRRIWQLLSKMLIKIEKRIYKKNMFFLMLNKG
jgi:hypothetical protein